MVVLLNVLRNPLTKRIAAAVALAVVTVLQANDLRRGLHHRPFAEANPSDHPTDPGGAAPHPARHPLTRLLRVGGRPGDLEGTRRNEGRDGELADGA